LLPDVWLDVSQFALELTVQAIFALTVMPKLPAFAATDWLVGATVRLGASAWVTVIVVETPPPLKVTVPVRKAPVLAVWLKVTELLPVPEFGLMLNQVALELAVQGTLAVTEAMKLPAASTTDLELGLMVNTGVVFPD
jgi:hypothetical protein